MRHFLPVLAAAVLAVGAAHAQQIGGPSTSVPPPTTDTKAGPGPGPQGGFESLDMDRNGKLSLTEAKRDPDLQKSFPTLDRNGDGQVDVSEYAKFRSSKEPGGSQDSRSLGRGDVNPREQPLGQPDPVKQPQGG